MTKTSHFLGILALYAIVTAYLAEALQVEGMISFSIWAGIILSVATVIAKMNE